MSAMTVQIALGFSGRHAKGTVVCSSRFVHAWLVQVKTLIANPTEVVLKYVLHAIIKCKPLVGSCMCIHI